MDDKCVGRIRTDVEVWAASLATAQANISEPDDCVAAQSDFDGLVRGNRLELSRPSA